MIDKSLRYNYQWGGPGGKSPGTSASGGSRNGGHDRGGGQHRAAAQRATQAPSPHRDDSAERAAQAVADTLNAARENEARETAREKAIQVAALTTKTPTRSPHKDTQEQIIEQKILDDYGYQDLKAKEPTVPPKRYRDVVVHHPEVDDVVPTEIRDLYSPTGYQDLSRATTGTMGERTWGEAAEAGIKRGSGILGTMGKIALTGLTAGAGAGLFGKDIATLAKVANYKKNYDRIQKSALGKKLGLKELDVSNLTSTIDKTAKLRSRPSDMPEHLGERGFKTRAEHEPVERDGIQQAITGENVIGESIKKYTSLTDDQVNYIRARLKGRDPEELRSILAQVESRIESGEASQEEKDVFALVQDYLVDPTQYTAHGGRIDGPLMGGSRYI